MFQKVAEWGSSKQSCQSTNQFLTPASSSTPHLSPPAAAWFRFKETFSSSRSKPSYPKYKQLVDWSNETKPSSPLDLEILFWGMIFSTDTLYSWSGLRQLVIRICVARPQWGVAAITMVHNVPSSKLAAWPPNSPPANPRVGLSVDSQEKVHL